MKDASMTVRALPRLVVLLIFDMCLVCSSVYLAQMSAEIQIWSSHMGISFISCDRLQFRQDDLDDESWCSGCLCMSSCNNLHNRPLLSEALRHECEEMGNSKCSIHRSSCFQGLHDRRRRGWSPDSKSRTWPELVHVPKH